MLNKLGRAVKKDASQKNLLSQKPEYFATNEMSPLSSV